MKKYNARTKANIPFDTIAGHQQYIELALTGKGTRLPQMQAWKAA